MTGCIIHTLIFLALVLVGWFCLSDAPYVYALLPFSLVAAAVFIDWESHRNGSKD